MTAEVGVVAHFEFLPDHDREIVEFFADGRLIVESQPRQTCWYAFRLSPVVYGAFAAFANEADREALLAEGGPALSASVAHLLARPPSFDKIDIVAFRASQP